MATVTVYQFLTWDHQNGRSVTSRTKSTLERIQLIGGKIVPGTAEDVDTAAIDAAGRYIPEPSVAQSA
jgi:hypothetical protein